MICCLRVAIPQLINPDITTMLFAHSNFVPSHQCAQKCSPGKSAEFVTPNLQAFLLPGSPRLCLKRPLNTCQNSLQEPCMICFPSIHPFAVRQYHKQYAGNNLQRICFCCNHLNNLIVIHPCCHMTPNLLLNAAAHCHTW